MAVVNTRKESLHASKHNIAKSAVGRTSKRLLDEVFVSLGKVKRRAVEAIFDSILRVGSPLVKDIALSVSNVTTFRKGLSGMTTDAAYTVHLIQS